MNAHVVDPSNAEDIYEGIVETTFRSAFDNELSSEESTFNMIAYMEEFFDLQGDAKPLLNVVDNTIEQIENLKEAFDEVR